MARGSSATSGAAAGAVRAAVPVVGVSRVLFVGRGRVVLGVVGVSRVLFVARLCLSRAVCRSRARRSRRCRRFSRAVCRSRARGCVVPGSFSALSAFLVCRCFSRSVSTDGSRLRSALFLVSSCRPFSRGRSSRPEALFRRVDRSVAVVHRGSPARGSPPVLAASAGTAASARPLTRRVPPRGPSLELDVDGMQPLLGCSPKK